MGRPVSNYKNKVGKFIEQRLEEINTLRAEKNAARRKELCLSTKDKLWDELEPLSQKDLAKAIRLSQSGLCKLLSEYKWNPSGTYVYAKIAAALVMRGDEAISFMHAAGIYIEADYPAFDIYRKIFELPLNANVEEINALLLAASGKTDVDDLPGVHNPQIAAILDTHYHSRH